MKCKICEKPVKKKFSAKILNKYTIDYLFCENCGFLQTEEPFWLEEAYEESINTCDTGYLSRNIYFSKVVSLFVSLYLDSRGQFLDYAGGYGVFVRLMRDQGYNFFWSDKYTKNLFAQGFSDENLIGKYEAITAFECFEHLVDPMVELEKMLEKTDTVIFSTDLLPCPVPEISKWFYYLPGSGQHISFFSKKTLKVISEEFSLNYASFRNLHFFSKKIKLSRARLAMLHFYRIGLHRFFTGSSKSLVNKDFCAMNHK